MAELVGALRETAARTAAAQASSKNEFRRTEVIVYFSGHADETGLLLGDETFPYRKLREWLDLLRADVRIAVLDGCAPGAISRLKGG